MATGGAFLAGYSAFLKDWYDDDLGIQSQINTEAQVISLFKKGTAHFEGKRAIIAIEVGRSDGVGFVNAAGKLPKPGHVEGEDYIVTSGVLATRGYIDRELMKAAPSKGKGAWLKAVDKELAGMKEAGTNRADIAAVAGGPVKGLLNEHKASNATNAGAPLGLGFVGPLADVAWEYFGDFTAFKPRGNATDKSPDSDDYKGVLLADSDTWIRVKLIEQKDYAEIAPAGGGAVITGIFIVGYDEELGTVTLKNVADAAGSSFTTAGVATGYATSLEFHQTQLTDAGGNKFGGVCTNVLQEFYGIFSNLCTQTHWNVDRTTATGRAVLQGNNLTLAVAGAHARIDFVDKRFYACKAKARRRLGKEKAKLDTLLCNDEQVANYIGVLTATKEYHVNNGNRKVDLLADDDNPNMGGKMLRTCQHVPNGGVIMLSMGTWRLYEREPGAMIDEDGSIFSRVEGYNHLEMAWTWSAQILCHTPGANAIVCGIKLY